MLCDKFPLLLLFFNSMGITRECDLLDVVVDATLGGAGFDAAVAPATSGLLGFDTFRFTSD